MVKKEYEFDVLVCQWYKISDETREEPAEWDEHCELGTKMIDAETLHDTISGSFNWNLPYPDEPDFENFVEENWDKIAKVMSIYELHDE